MNVYVESNFVLELAFMQEQQESCENILRLCEAGKLRVLVPAYSIVEPHETVTRRVRDRKALQERFAKEAEQLIRSEPYKGESDFLQRVTNVLARSSIDERQRLDLTVGRLVEVTDVIPLNAEILTRAQDLQKSLELAPQDAVVYASVIQHLTASASATNCFLNRNSRDFDSPDIKEELGKYNCKILFSFDTGLAYIRSQLTDS